MILFNRVKFKMLKGVQSLIEKQYSENSPELLKKLPEIVISKAITKSEAVNILKNTCYTSSGFMRSSKINDVVIGVWKQIDTNSLYYFYLKNKNTVQKITSKFNFSPILTTVRKLEIIITKMLQKRNISSEEKLRLKGILNNFSDTIRIMINQALSSIIFSYSPLNPEDALSKVAFGPIMIYIIVKFCNSGAEYLGGSFDSPIRGLPAPAPVPERDALISHLKHIRSKSERILNFYNVPKTAEGFSFDDFANCTENYCKKSSLKTIVSDFNSQIKSLKI